MGHGWDLLRKNGRGIGGVERLDEVLWSLPPSIGTFWNPYSLGMCSNQDQKPPTPAQVGCSLENVKKESPAAVTCSKVPVTSGPGSTLPAPGTVRFPFKKGMLTS